MPFLRHNRSQLDWGLRFAHPLPEAVIVDLDGTLARIGDRSPYDGHLCAVDTVIEPIAQITRGLDRGSFMHRHTFILSGRHERARAATTQWLAYHRIRHDRLFLRASEEDFRPGHEFKREVYEREIAPRYDVVLAIDDDPDVVQMWAKLGVLCLAMPWEERP